MSNSAENLSLVSLLNDNEVMKIMEETGVTLRANDAHNWRPTKRVRGLIPGQTVRLTILMTNGILGLFTRESGGPLFAHTNWFTGKVEPLYSTSTGAGKKPKTKSADAKASKRREAIQSILDLIN